jgi:hypothetical protein
MMSQPLGGGSRFEIAANSNGVDYARMSPLLHGARL